jgi:hypothetical protein
MVAVVALVRVIRITSSWPDCRNATPILSQIEVGQPTANAGTLWRCPVTPAIRRGFARNAVFASLYCKFIIINKMCGGDAAPNWVRFV